jgi:3-oxoacyl-[acyl-carrier protein] reductase
MDLGIKGKIAIVTGASKGMGLAIVNALVAEGVKVLLVARNAETLAATVDQIKKSGGEAAFVAGDVSNADLPQLVISKIQSAWNDSADILINNAGGPPVGSFLEHGADAWDSAIQINLLSAVRFSKAVAPQMKEKKWGRIISITSTIAKEPSAVMVLSATVRSGVSAFTKAISSELASFNVTANVICPGGVSTDRLTNLIKTRAERENRAYEDVLKESEASIPAQRFASPEEIASTVSYLVSQHGSYITGLSISVDGGLTKSF